MGDAGFILFGPLGREILSLGTIIFAVFATGSQMLAGQLALQTLSNNKLCLMLYTGIFAIACTVGSIPRTLDNLAWLSMLSTATIIVAGVLGMVAAGVEGGGTPGQVDLGVSTDFTTAFIAVTNPVFAYAGHFMFFILISEMKRPQDAMKVLSLPHFQSSSLFLPSADLTARRFFLHHSPLPPGSVDASNLRHSLLHRFRRRDILLHRPLRALSVLPLPYAPLVKNHFWNRDP